MSGNALEAEYKRIMRKHAFPIVYQNLCHQSKLQKFPCLESSKTIHRAYNRYRDVLAYDHTRIVLQRERYGYINANTVELERANRKYILTQGPLDITINHFWLMVWEQNSRAIIMLNKLVERSEKKCHFYWPAKTGPDHTLVLNDIRLDVVHVVTDEYENYIKRIFRITDQVTKESREITQFHYITWPDFGVPSSPGDFIDFLETVRESGVLDAGMGPPIVHCSAGIGRSGTFCLVDVCLCLVEKDETFTLSEILLELRKQRMGLIQTPEQLRFSYQAIIEGGQRTGAIQVTHPTSDDEIYEIVMLAEKAPPPPPRVGSLRRVPARPLPAIPNSASLGDLYQPLCSPSSDGDVPNSVPNKRNGSASATDDEDDEPEGRDPIEHASEPEAGVRRRKNLELAERVSEMKRKARDAERWHAVKRSLYKPLTITFGVIFCGVVLYAYLKR